MPWWSWEVELDENSSETGDFGLQLQYCYWDTLHTLWVPKSPSAAVYPVFLNVPCSLISAVSTSSGHQIVELQLLKEISCSLFLMSPGSLLPRPLGDQTWFPMHLAQQKRLREEVEGSMTDGDYSVLRESQQLLIDQLRRWCSSFCKRHLAWGAQLQGRCWLSTCITG